MRYLDHDTGRPSAGAPYAALISAQAEATPNAPAISFSGRSLTFCELDHRSSARADLLRSHGVKPGDVVLIALSNTPEFLECAFAIWKIGAVPCPVSNRLSGAEFEAIVLLANPRLILSDREISHLPAPLLIVGDTPAPASNATLPPEAASKPGKITTSGGSTGRPKLIVDPLPASWGDDKKVFGLEPRGTILNASPLYHSGPFNICTSALCQGCHVVLMEKFDAVDWVTAVERYRVEFAYLVPTIMTRIAKAEGDVVERADLSSLKTVIHTAAPCPPATKRWWIERIGPRKLVEIYGGAERIGSTMIDGLEWLERPGSVGRARPGHRIAILDESGRELAPGEIGEICFARSSDLLIRYEYVGAAPRSQSLDGFGDQGWVDEEGYLFIADRRTDMVVIGGANVFPAEIEAAIDALPGILCSAVIGLPDADLGNRLHAIIEIPHDTLAPTTLSVLSALRETLTGFKVPKSIEFTFDRIRDDAGKVRRSALRAERMETQSPN